MTTNRFRLNLCLSFWKHHWGCVLLWIAGNQKEGLLPWECHTACADLCFLYVSRAPVRPKQQKVRTVAACGQIYSSFKTINYNYVSQWGRSAKFWWAIFTLWIMIWSHQFIRNARSVLEGMRVLYTPQKIQKTSPLLLRPLRQRLWRWKQDGKWLWWQDFCGRSGCISQEDGESILWGLASVQPAHLK